MCKYCSNLKRIKEIQINDLMLIITGLKSINYRWRKIELQERQLLLECLVYVPDKIKKKIHKHLERSVI